MPYSVSGQDRFHVFSFSLTPLSTILVKENKKTLTAFLRKYLGYLSKCLRFQTQTYSNCSVKGSTVKGKGSCGAVIGHATASDWTLVNINGAVIENNTVASTSFAFTRAGSVIGTVGCAGLEKTVNGISHTGGTYITALTESGNTVTSNGSTIDRIYGRQGDSAGKLYVDGAEVKF